MVQETTGSKASETTTELPIEPTTSTIEKSDSTRDERAIWRGWSRRAAQRPQVPQGDLAAT